MGGSNRKGSAKRSISSDKRGASAKKSGRSDKKQARSWLDESDENDDSFEEEKGGDKDKDEGLHDGTMNLLASQHQSCDTIISLVDVRP